MFRELEKKLRVFLKCSMKWYILNKPSFFLKGDAYPNHDMIEVNVMNNTLKNS